MKKAVLITIISLMMVLILSSISSGLSLLNTQFSQGNSAWLNIYAPKPIIVRSDGDTGLLNYDVRRISDQWNVSYCHKDYQANYVRKPLITRQRFSTLPIVSENGALRNPPSFVDMDNECGSFTLDADIGSRFRIGFNGHGCPSISLGFERNILDF